MVCFEDGDRLAGLEQGSGGGEPGRAGPDDDDVRALHRVGETRE